MRLSGDRSQQNQPRGALLHACGQFRGFDRRELALIERLSGLRLIHHSAWLASRLNDSAFPINFYWFGTRDCWQGQVDRLVEQTEEMQAAPLMACERVKTPFLSIFFTLACWLAAAVAQGLLHERQIRGFFVWFLTGSMASERHSAAFTDPGISVA